MFWIPTSPPDDGLLSRFSHAHARRPTNAGLLRPLRHTSPRYGHCPFFPPRSVVTPRNQHTRTDPDEGTASPLDRSPTTISPRRQTNSRPSPRGKHHRFDPLKVLGSASIPAPAVPPALLACARYVVPPLSFRKWPPAVQEGPRKFQSSELSPVRQPRFTTYVEVSSLKKGWMSRVHRIIPYTPETPIPETKSQTPVPLWQPRCSLALPLFGPPVRGSVLGAWGVCPLRSADGQRTGRCDVHFYTGAIPGVTPTILGVGARVP